MLKKRWMDTRGHYLLALLCAAVIVFSALWTRSQPSKPAQPNAQALSDGSQRLADVTPLPAAPSFLRPVSGRVLQGYSREAVWFPQVSLWHTHPAVDFQAADGESVKAIAGGTVKISGGTLYILPDANVRIAYRGLREITVQEGQSVRAGEEIGHAGGSVPFEGSGQLCVAVWQDERSVDFSGMLSSAAPDVP